MNAHGMTGEDLIFIVGSGRSGTTMIRKILQADDRIGVSPELRFFSHDYQYSGKSSTFITHVARAMEKSGDPLYSELQLDIREITQQIFSNSETVDVKDIFIQLLRLTSTNQNAKLFVEKSGINIFYLDIISTLFPKAKIVHVYRDGREYAASAEKIGRTSQIEPLVGYWIESIRYFEKMKSLIKNPVLEISYEDLTEQPDVISQQLYKFLGLGSATKLNEVLDNLTPSSSFAKHKHRTGVYKSENFKTHFSPVDQAVMSFYLHKTLTLKGYDSNIHDTKSPGLISLFRYYRFIYMQRLHFFLSKRRLPRLRRYLRGRFRAPR